MIRFRRRHLLLGVACVLLAEVSVAQARPTKASVCQAAKMKAVAKKTTSVFACEARAAAAGDEVDPGCLAAADDKYWGSFAKLEARGGCRTFGDAAPMAARIAAFERQMALALPPVRRAPVCSAVKLKAAARYVAALLIMHADRRKAAKSTSLIRSSEEAVGELDQTLGTVERDASCRKTGERDSIVERSESFVAAAVEALWPLSALGVSLGMPAGWQIDPADLADGRITLTNFGARYGQGGSIPADGADIVMSSVPPPRALRPAEVLANDLRQPRITVTATDTLTVGGEPAARAFYFVNSGGLVERHVAVYVVHAGTSRTALYKFLLTYADGEPRAPEFVSAFDQVLASVRFTP
jgi:hypothetical protein